ncbi:MAG: hypothetical protein WC455_07195 [Dehalococcoidia bacterium]|jgi:hypothetical protein
MSSIEILFNIEGRAIAPEYISEKIGAFGDKYNDATSEIIRKSETLDKDIFLQCASRILSSFGMTRSGPFHEDCEGTLRNCWRAIGSHLVEINKSVRKSGISRNRYIVEINDAERDALIDEIWLITKKLLPLTMGKTSYGLVGASKILFSVLPEIVLPIDNSQWVSVFQTVDMSDILHRMVSDIKKWEKITGKRLNELDPSKPKKLTTLPSVYNVMAMAARPKD